MNKNIENKIENALTSELISYIAGYQALGINKETSILCMVELDKRRQNGDSTNYEEEIKNQSEIMKSIGTGIAVVAMNGVQLDSLCKMIRDLNCYCMVMNRDSGILHIGKADQILQEKISQLPGVKEVLPDKKVLQNVIGPTIS